MRISNGCIIEVTLYEYPRYTYDTDTVAEWIEEYTSDPILDNGVPLSIEVASWCECATLGAEYEYEGMTIKIVEDD